MGTHPIFESDFDCLTEKMWTESIPCVCLYTGIVYAASWWSGFGHWAGKHKGFLAGGAPYFWGNGFQATGNKMPNEGIKYQYTYCVENHAYGRTMQMSLDAARTQWIHPDHARFNVIGGAEENLTLLDQLIYFRK